MEPITVQETSLPPFDTTVADEASKSEPPNHVPLVDYSNLFGEEFCIPDDPWDSNYLNLLDIKAVEEGILHVLYACASQVGYCIRNARTLRHRFYTCDVHLLFLMLF